MNNVSHYDCPNRGEQVDIAGDTVSANCTFCDTFVVLSSVIETTSIDVLLSSMYLSYTTQVDSPTVRFPALGLCPFVSVFRRAAIKIRGDIVVTMICVLILNMQSKT